MGEGRQPTEKVRKHSQEENVYPDILITASAIFETSKATIQGRVTQWTLATVQPASWREFVHVFLNRVKAERVPSGILERPGKECSKKLSHNHPSTCNIWGSRQKETWELWLRNRNSKVWVIETPHRARAREGSLGQGWERAQQSWYPGSKLKTIWSQMFEVKPYWFSHSCYILGKEGYTRMKHFVSQ